MTINAPGTCSADPETVDPGGSSTLSWTATSSKSVSSPTSGPVGTEVTITGTNFGATRIGSNVTFNGTRAPDYTSWSDTRIVVEVPEGATSGPVVIFSLRGGRIEVGNFTVTEATDPLPDPPAITSFTANPTAVDLGEQSTLSWTVSGATGLSINQDVGSVTPVTSGTKTVDAEDGLGHHDLHADGFRWDRD